MRLERVLGPVVLRIPATQVLAHLGVASAPKARQIARHLHRALRRGQQFEGQRNLAATDARCLLETEDFLQPDRHDRGALVEVVDANVGAARNLQMRRGQTIELALLLPVQQTAKRIGHGQASQMVATCHALEPGAQPVIERVCERTVGCRGPGTALRGAATNEFNASLQVAGVSGPGQRPDAQFTHSPKHGRSGCLRRDLGQGPFFQHELVEFQDTTRNDRLLARAPLDRLDSLQALGHELIEIGPTDRRREQNARIAIAIIEIHRDDQLVFRQRLSLGKMGPAPACKSVLPGRPCATAAYSIRVRERQQDTRIVDLAAKIRCQLPASGAADLAHEIARRTSGTLQAVPGNSAGSRFTPHEIYPRHDVDISRRHRAAKYVALRQQRRQIGGEWQTANVPRPQQHVREARMQTEIRHFTPVSGDATGLIERTQTRQKIACARKRCGRRGVQPA